MMYSRYDHGSAIPGDQSVIHPIYTAQVLLLADSQTS